MLLQTRYQNLSSKTLGHVVFTEMGPILGGPLFQ
jgi:hypothetical protein